MCVCVCVCVCVYVCINLYLTIFNIFTFAAAARLNFGNRSLFKRYFLRSRFLVTSTLPLVLFTYNIHCSIFASCLLT